MKDASATAIYGARGANGVVLITTRNGRSGKMKISYDGYAGIQNVANKINLLDSEEYHTIINDIINSGGGSTTDLVENYTGEGTDWLGEVYNPNAGIQSHNLSLSGGNESTNYLISLNYFNQGGLIMNSSFERYGLRFTLDHKVGEKFHTSLYLSSNYSDDQFTPGGFSLNDHARLLFPAMPMTPPLKGGMKMGHYVLPTI